MNRAVGASPGGAIDSPVGTDQLPTPATRNIEVHVDGNVTGQLAVGENILQIDNKPGAILNLYNGKPIVPRRRPTPVLLPPRPFPDLLGRTAEVAAAKAAMRAAQPFEYYASPGWGKTSLLRSVGQLAAGACPDGIVYQPSSGQPLDDLLQFCFDVFYETDVPIKPTPGQLRQSLLPIRALIILDDLDLDRDQLGALFTSLPNCVFLLAAKEETLWESGQAERVAGLAKEAAAELFERETGRLLSAGEQPAFEQLWSSLGGNPLGLIQAAAALRDKNQSLAELAGAESVASPDERIIAHLVSALSPDEHKVLGLLASVYDAALPASHVAAITGVAESAAILLRLTQHGLAEMKDGGYRLSREPAGALTQTVDPQQWIEPSIGHFAVWAERFANDPRLILAVADLLLKVLELAMDTQRWKEVWRIVRAVEPSLALSGRWGAWQLALNSGLRAAHALQDRFAEGWVLHQLGTRSLCLGDVADAATFLNQALSIREVIGDHEGAAATSHNLQRLPPPAPPAPPTPAPSPLPRVHRLRWILRIGLALGAAVIAGFVFPQPGQGSYLGQFLFPTGVVSLEPNQPLNFGKVAVGRTSLAQTITVHNSGNGSMQLTAISTDRPFEQTNTCQPPVALAPNGSCSIFLTFNPRSTGKQSGNVSLAADGKTYSAALSGDGIFTWRLEPLPIVFDPAMIGVVQRKELRLTNTSGAPLRLKTIGIKAQTKSFGVEATGCVPGIAPGASCVIVVGFAPVSAGPLADTLVIADTIGDQKEYELSGQGIPVPLAKVSPSFVDWAKDRNLPNPVRITLTNTGSASVFVSSVLLSGDSSPVFVIVPNSDGCSSRELTPQNPQCAIDVGYVLRNAGRTGPDFNGTLQFFDNASDSPQIVHLHMQG